MESGIRCSVWVRRFRAVDLPQVFDLASRTLNEVYNPQFLMDLHTYWPEGFLVIEEYGRVMGFIAGIRMSNAHARILMLGVEQNRRRRGYASMLCREFIKECGMLRMRMISLEVRLSNVSAIALYEKLGFNLVLRIDGYYTDGESALKMQLIL
jgi:ribosomal-protein-alanine N-acetyltransferase